MLTRQNDYTLDVHIHLRQVALLESRIAEVVKPLTTLENDFKSTYAFPHLSRLHELPFAYMALVLEYRWRIEFGENFAAWCNRLGQAIVQMLSPEVKRREEINKEVLSCNPFSIYGLDDSTVPFCETNFHTGGEALKVLALDKSILTGKLNSGLRMQRPNPYRSGRLDQATCQRDRVELPSWTESRCPVRRHQAAYKPL